MNKPDIITIRVSESDPKQYTVAMEVSESGAILFLGTFDTVAKAAALATAVMRVLAEIGRPVNGDFSA